MLLHLPQCDKRAPSSLWLLQNTRRSSSLLCHDPPTGHIQPTRHRSATSNLNRLLGYTFVNRLLLPTPTTQQATTA